MGDTHVLCSKCRLPITDREDGHDDPSAGLRPMHTDCRIRHAQEGADRATTVALTLSIGKLVQASGLASAKAAWSQTINALPAGYSPDDLRLAVQRMLVSLLAPSHPDQAKLLVQIEHCFARFPAAKQSS